MADLQQSRRPRLHTKLVSGSISTNIVESVVVVKSDRKLVKAVVLCALLSLAPRLQGAIPWLHHVEGNKINGIFS